MRPTIIFLVLLFCNWEVFCQQFDLSGIKVATVKVFRNSLYVFGYMERDGVVVLKSMKMDSVLAIEKQNELVIGPSAQFEYPSISIDTLHNRLSISFPNVGLKEKSTLIRYNHNLELIQQFTDVPSARLNTFFAFDTDVFYSGNIVYSIRRISSDSSGQFLLRKFKLESENGKEEYTELWQFAFKNSSYSTVQIVGSGHGRLFLFAHASEGLRKGQWVLQLNEISGKVINATQLTGKDPNKSFFVHISYFDSVEAKLLLAGTYLSTEFLLSDNLSLINQKLSKQFSLGLILVDTSSSVSDEKEFKMPLPADCSNTKKYTNLFLNCTAIRKSNDKYILFSSVMGTVLAGTFHEFGMVVFEYSKTQGVSKMSQGIFSRTDLSEKKDIVYMNAIPQKYARENQNAFLMLKDGVPKQVMRSNFYSTEKSYYWKYLFWKDEPAKKLRNLFLNDFCNSKLTTRKIKEFNSSDIKIEILFTTHSYSIALISNLENKEMPDFHLEKIIF